MAKKSPKKVAPKAKTVEEIIHWLEELAEDFEQDHTDVFLSHVEHADARVRNVAIRCLWEANLEQVWDVLKTHALGDSDSEVRATAFSVMGRYMYEEMLHDVQELPAEEIEAPLPLLRDIHTFLAECLHNENLPLLERRRCLEALSYNPSDKELVLMENWSKSTDNDLRMTSIFAMGRSSLEKFKPQVLAALEDAHLDVRREAIRAIGEGGYADCIPQLEALIAGNDRDLMFEAVAALGEVGGPRAIAILEGMSGSADAELAELAEVALVNAQEMKMFEEYQDSLGQDEDGAEGDDMRPYLKH